MIETLLFKEYNLLFLKYKPWQGQ